MVVVAPASLTMLLVVNRVSSHRKLDVSANRLSSSIPSTISLLTNLQYVAVCIVDDVDGVEGRLE